MMTTITVLIIGAGRFARNYIRVLAGLNRVSFPALRIERLIVSRTRPAEADQTAQVVQSEYPGIFPDVIGIGICDVHQLQEVLSGYHPHLICITARDPILGDRIHAQYAPLAMDCGRVLCEKPFSNASGNGASLKVLEAMIRGPYPSRFGMHLPMAVVLQTMSQIDGLRRLMDNPSRLEFLWQKQNGSADLVCDLAPHPWSLIPTRREVEPRIVQNESRRMTIDFRWQAQALDVWKSGRMMIESGGAFRGMCIDDTVLQFEFAKDRLQVIKLNCAWPHVHQTARNASLVLEIENPLKLHIQSLLQDRPIVDLEKTYLSQLFLERVRGYSQRTSQFQG